MSSEFGGFKVVTLKNSLCLRNNIFGGGEDSLTGQLLCAVSLYIIYPNHISTKHAFQF